MSWKGFQKGLVRTPQNLRQKMHKGNQTTDLVYLDAEDRFNSIEAETKKLQNEARRYWGAVNTMLAHQIKYSEILETVYQPISGRLSDPNQTPQEDGHEAGIAACQQYRQLVNELQELIRPELEMIESRIIRPTEEMLTIMGTVRKMFTKREHKQLDLDRQSQSLKRAQDKNDHTTKHEERVYKVENEYQMALEEYNYYNNLLKDELPKLFELQGNFIRPLFQSFYYMQISIFYTLHENMESMKIPYFDTQSDILQTFHQKRGDVLARAENIGILQFRSNKKQGGGFLGRQSSVATHASNRGRDSDDSDDPWGDSDDEQPPPRPAHPPMPRAESPPPNHAYSRAHDPALSSQQHPPHYGDVSPSGAPVNIREKHEFAEVPPAKPARPNHPPGPRREVCVALYDYEPQAEGDLALIAGDRIEITEKTDSQQGWWKGILNGRTGVFPANYVQLE